MNVFSLFFIRFIFSF